MNRGGAAAVGVSWEECECERCGDGRTRLYSRRCDWNSRGSRLPEPSSSIFFQSISVDDMLGRRRAAEPPPRSQKRAACSHCSAVFGPFC